MIKNATVGACGICCDTCKLHETLKCSCSAGTEEYGINKVKTNWDGKGVLCLVLKCAVEKKIAYCPRDCEEFPCNKFREWMFPYGETYLKMQKERRLKTNPEINSG